jgi:hypothetical protein
MNQFIELFAGSNENETYTTIKSKTNEIKEGVVLAVPGSNQTRPRSHVELSSTLLRSS